MKQLRFFIITLLLQLALLTAGAQTNTELNADAFEKNILQRDSVQLLDVRTAGEFKQGHLKDALLADWKDEKEFYRRIGFIDKEKPVYIYCLGGGRSAAAAAKMRGMGFQQVIELKGGINAWKAAGKNVANKMAVPQMSIDDLDAQLSGNKTVLVDVGAEWCPPCKVMEPVLQQLAAHHPKKFTLVKVDGGRDEAILKKYNITTLPVFMLFKKGQLVWRKEGIVAEEEIARLLY